MAESGLEIMEKEVRRLERIIAEKSNENSRFMEKFGELYRMPSTEEDYDSIIVRKNRLTGNWEYVGYACEKCKNGR